LTAPAYARARGRSASRGKKPATFFRNRGPTLSLSPETKLSTMERAPLDLPDPRRTTIMKPTTTLSITIIALAAGLAGPASASTYWECANGKPMRWPGDNVAFRASAFSFPPGPPGGEFTQALVDAAASWSATPTNFDFSIEINSSAVGFDNGQNETWFTDELPANVGGSTTVWWNSDCEIEEVDIRFNSTYSHSASTTKTDLMQYGGDFRSFHAVVLHELGHALGLLHTANAYSVMGNSYSHLHTDGSIAEAYPGEDGVSGATFLYGKVSGEFEDLARYRRFKAPLLPLGFEVMVPEGRRGAWLERGTRLGLPDSSALGVREGDPGRSRRRMRRRVRPRCRGGPRLEESPVRSRTDRRVALSPRRGEEALGRARGLRGSPARRARG